MIKKQRSTGLLKTLVCLVILSNSLILFGAGAQETGPVSVDGLGSKTTLQEVSVPYNKVEEIFDWGAATTKVVLDIGFTVPKDVVSNDTFSVHVTRSDSRVIENPLLEAGIRPVVDVYPSDEKGDSMDNGKYLTLEMLVGPTESLGSPLNYYNRSNAWIDCEYSITQEKPISTDSLMITGIKAEKLGKQFRLGVDDFSLGSYTYNDAKWGEITLGYAAFKPETAGNRPLIIWLHGGGEGGTDATIPLSANKSVNLASEEIQEIFGGAYVLVPQTPTRWMDDGTGESMHSPGAMYTHSLKYLIDQYVADNPGVDTNRIYLGGCSNGGYMTIDLLLDYPEYFAAAYPVCEGMHDVELTDSDIETLKKTPMWFTTAATDRTLPAPANTVGTYDRLVKAGDERVLLTYYRDIHDLSGKYFDEEGNPYEYNGHWSWIHVYNNENTLIIDGKETTIMEWLADQSL